MSEWTAEAFFLAVAFLPAAGGKQNRTNEDSCHHWEAAVNTTVWNKKK